MLQVRACGGDVLGAAAESRERGSFPSETGDQVWYGPKLDRRGFGAGQNCQGSDVGAIFHFPGSDSVRGLLSRSRRHLRDRAGASKVGSAAKTRAEKRKCEPCAPFFKPEPCDRAPGRTWTTPTIDSLQKYP